MKLPIGSRLMDQAFREKEVEAVCEFPFSGKGIKTVYLQDDGTGYFVLEIDEATESYEWVNVTKTICAAGCFPPEIQDLHLQRARFEPRSPQLDRNASAVFAREVLGESY